MVLSLPSKNVINRIHAKQAEKYDPEKAETTVDDIQLGAALAWPRLMVTAENSSDIFDVATSLLIGIISEKPYPAGNIRLAFTIAILTIRRNGWIPDISNDEALRLMAALKTENITEEKAADFLRRKSLKE